MIKTRFAPSPTGYLHVGGLRTALYCYLFAKKSGGKFILRIEDTDQERFVEGALENLIETLEWIGITYDEGPYKNDDKITEKGDCGPYIQSNRTEIYKKHVQELIDKGEAYHCFCTKERLDEMRERQAASKQAPMYDRKCLELPKSEVQEKLAAGEKFVIRQKLPYELIKFKDLVRGSVQFDGKIIDDQILMKSDGFPTYHLANVVDDHLMEITHVIRGEEWLPSTPKHLALYKSFGWVAPEFAHLPLLLNPDRTKLSKRQGHVAVEEYIKEGYGKEAIINFVVFLGWNPGGGEENEIFTLKQLEEIFSLEKVHKSGAIFNLEKLDWFNWRWKKEKFQKELELIAKETDQTEYKFTSQENEDKFLKKRAGLLLEMCNDSIPEKFKKDEDKLFRALITIEEKVLRTPKETAENLKFYFEIPQYDKELLTHEKMGVDFNRATESLKSAKETLEKVDNWSLNALTQSLLQKIQELNIKNGQMLWPLRAALSGQEFSPGAFELAWTLGKEETIKRLETALKKL